MLANSVSVSCGIPMTMPYVAMCAAFDQLHVDADLLAKVKGVVDHLKQLLQHVFRGRLVSPIDHYLHYIVEREVIDTFVVASIGHL